MTAMAINERVRSFVSSFIRSMSSKGSSSSSSSRGEGSSASLQVCTDDDGKRQEITSEPENEGVSSCERNQRRDRPWRCGKTVFFCEILKKKKGSEKFWDFFCGRFAKLNLIKAEI